MSHRSSSSLIAAGIASASSHFESIATFFGNNEITGTVSVYSGNVQVNLDISKLEPNILGGNECFSNGFKYYIGSKWNHNDNYDRIGSSACSSEYTGYHWDPWLACGPETGNDDCESQGGCVTGSSVLSDSKYYCGYECDAYTFGNNPYVCEVGDWSGKYGNVEVDMYTGKVCATNSDAFEVEAGNLDGLSVVFECGDGDGTRVFCAPFVYDQVYDEEYDRPSQGSSGKIAKFDVLGDDSFIKLDSNGDYDISFAVDGSLLPDKNCDYLEYRIYNGWTNDDCLSSVGEDACVSDNGIGMFYDPTVSCAIDSDSEFCEQSNGKGGQRCGDDYQCYVCDFQNAPFDCAPGDLSGKYGAFYHGGSSYGSVLFSETGNDDFMIDLRQLDGKSAVLQCRDSREVIACAQFRDYDSDFGDNFPSKCDDSPCCYDDTLQCKVYEHGEGCTECEDGYYQLNQDYPCVECESIFGDACEYCSDAQGCAKCKDGYFGVWDRDYGLNICL